MIITRHQPHDGLWLLLDELEREAVERAPGHQAVAGRLAEIIFLRQLRSHIASSQHLSRGLLAAVADPRLASVLNAMHTRFAADWSVAKLAMSVGMSRTAFSEVFASKVGEPPMRYLYRCRLLEAARLLRVTNDGIAEVALTVGYQDAPSFSRAFRRQFDKSPTAYRKEMGALSG